MSRTNKVKRQNSNRKIVGGIKKHLTRAVTLEGVTYTPAKLGQMFQEGIDVADATDAAKKVWHVSVAVEKQKTLEVSGVQASLRSHVSALFGEASTVFSDFGFAPRTAKTVDAATKAAAVKKRAATRKARHTMGARQKADVTGETSPVTTVPTASATPAASVAPTGEVPPAAAAPKPA